ncbi:hypothetical protein WJX84_007259 [Apatococcus fuscideae]|uniref:Uncharacterized protein n=1 Tax=Apatococcus fuscideae TaxID=2026836 RepID=A0AAW1TGR9_9CHLO
MLQVCDTVDSSVSRKGPEFAEVIKRRTGKLRDAVVEIAAALKAFEDELVIGYKRAVKTTRTPAMLQSKAGWPIRWTDCWQGWRRHMCASGRPSSRQ